MDFVQYTDELTLLLTALEQIEREHAFARKRCMHHMEKMLSGDRWAWIFYHGARQRIAELEERANIIKKRIGEIELVQWDEISKQNNRRA